jgi:ribose 5-phosphate isomerase B
MKIFLGTDHAGFELKEQVKDHLLEAGYEVEDKGAFTYNGTDDYPNFIAPVARSVSELPDDRRGIIFGHSGQGEAIVANRFPHVRTTVYYGGPSEILTLGREHNDANVLSLAAGFLSVDEAMQAVDLWLATDFSRIERHERRIAKIEDVSSN